MKIIHNSWHRQLLVLSHLTVTYPGIKRNCGGKGTIACPDGYLLDFARSEGYFRANRGVKTGADLGKRKDYGKNRFYFGRAEQN